MAATAEAEGGEFTPGASIIKIHHTSKKKAFEGEWIVVLSRAVETAHDVKSFSRHNKDLTELEIVFYGIAINTATAATTFEMVRFLSSTCSPTSH